MKSEQEKIETLPDWFNMNLSELIEKSLAMKVVPVFQFLDKDKVEVSESPSIPILKRTAVQVLEAEVLFFRRIIKKIETREGITSDTPEADKNLKSLIGKCRSRIRIFKKAINKLNH